MTGGAGRTRDGGKAKSAKPLTLPGKAVAQIDRPGVRQLKVAASTAEETEGIRAWETYKPISQQRIHS